MKNNYSLSMTTENALRVLQRIATVLAKHRINIEKLNVSETQTKGVSHFNIVVCTEENLLTKLVKQLQRIVEVYEVHVAHTATIPHDNLMACEQAA